MRHGIAGKKLSRDTNSRKALLKNLTSDLILHGQIKTTLAKAKFARGYAEKLITTAKQSKLGKKRTVAAVLTKSSFKRLVEEIAPGFVDRNGGYIRIIRLEPRRGDNAPMAKLELVEWDKSKTLKKAVPSKSKAPKVPKGAKNKLSAKPKQDSKEKSTEPKPKTSQKKK